MKHHCTKQNILEMINISKRMNCIPQRSQTSTHGWGEMQHQLKNHPQVAEHGTFHRGCSFSIYTEDILELLNNVSYNCKFLSDLKVEKEGQCFDAIYDENCLLGGCFRPLILVTVTCESPSVLSIFV